MNKPMKKFIALNVISKKKNNQKPESIRFSRKH